MTTISMTLREVNDLIDTDLRYNTDLMHHVLTLWRAKAEASPYTQRLTELQRIVADKREAYDPARAEGTWMIRQRFTTTSTARLDSAKVKRRYPDVYEQCRVLKPYTTIKHPQVPDVPTLALPRANRNMRPAQLAEVRQTLRDGKAPIDAQIKKCVAAIQRIQREWDTRLRLRGEQWDGSAITTSDDWTLGTTRPRFDSALLERVRPDIYRDNLVITPAGAASRVELVPYRDEDIDGISMWGEGDRIAD